MKGIDLSVHNRGLHIQSRMCDFVILRAGFTGWGKRTFSKDAKFEEFYSEAKSAGIPVGAYWYSCANTYDTGKAEAQYMYEKCLKDKSFEFPIYIDVEETRWQIGNKKGVTDAILGFCEYLDQKNFITGVYSSTSWFRDQIDTNRLEKYSKWVAAWRPTKPDFPYSHFDMWQYSENGRINGCHVDLNVCYKDFPAEIKKAGKNGFEYIKGDVNNDGKVTSEDARKAIRASVGLEELSDAEKKAADMNYDGKVTSEDAREILKRAVGDPITYTVQDGDTLTGIAKKYGITVNKLKKDNSISAADLKTGMKLIIKE